jgi:hypothetical protein
MEFVEPSEQRCRRSKRSSKFNHDSESPSNYRIYTKLAGPLSSDGGRGASWTRRTDGVYRTPSSPPINLL